MNEKVKTSQDEKYFDEIKGIVGENFIDNILSEERDELLFSEKVKKLLAHLMGIGEIREKKDSISSSQLRNIFSRVKRVKNINQLYSLRPKLAYVYGRPNTKTEMKKLLAYLDNVIKSVKDEKQIAKFIDFFESIIAYHKFYGGSN